MRQRYDNVTKFVTTEYAEPFVELILKYPNATVLENLATEQITLKARETDDKTTFTGGHHARISFFP